MEHKKSDLELLLSKKSVKCLVALILPIVLMVAVFAYAGIYSDSSKFTVLSSDLNGQYISYLAYLRHLLSTGQFDFYTFTKTLGGDIYGFSAYYLFSPFNIILLFFPLEHITRAVYVITVAKIGFAGLSMFYLISKKHGFYYKNLIFSISYALMAYNLAYHMHLMWLDAMVMLPLTVYGIERIIEGKRSWYYSLFLALTMMTCYYTGYMVCIFVVLYFGWRLFGEKRGFKAGIKAIGSFIFGSLIGGGVSAFVWLPALMSLSGSKETSVGLSFNGLQFNFNPLDFPAKLFTGCFNSDEFFAEGLADGMPNLYCGILILLLLFIYFMQKKTKVREKIFTFLVMSVLFLSLYNRELALAWHGFAEPNSFTYRFAFVVSFFAIVVASNGFYRLDKEDNIIRTYLIPVVLLFLCAGFAFVRGAEYTKTSHLIMDCTEALVFVVFLTLYQKKQNDVKPVFLAVVGVLHAAALYYNGCQYVKVQEYQMRDIEGYVSEMKPILEEIETTDKDPFYRMEKDFYYSINDHMLFNIYGLSHFSSTEKLDKKLWMRKLGYSLDFTYWNYYDKGATVTAETLLGVRYVLRKDKTNYQNYDLYAKENGIAAYYNPDALSIGFLTKGTREIEEENPFAYQNALINEMTGETNEILQPVDNVNAVGEGTEKSVYSFDVKKSGPYYAYFFDGYQIKVYLNGEFLRDHLSAYRNGIVPLGYYEAGDKVEVMVEGPSKSIFYREDLTELKKRTDVLSRNNFYLYSFSQDQITGEVYGEEDKPYLVFSIPYEEEWEVKVDTKKQETFAAYGSLLAVPLTEGNHEITLKYVTKGFMPGVYISLVCLLIGAVVYGISFFKGRNVEYEISSVPL